MDYQPGGVEVLLVTSCWVSFDEIALIQGKGEGGVVVIILIT